MTSLKLTGCMNLVARMSKEDQDALLERLDKYTAGGMPPERAQVAAAHDTLAEIEAEHEDFHRMLREQHPDLATEPLSGSKEAAQGAVDPNATGEQTAAQILDDSKETVPNDPDPAEAQALEKAIEGKSYREVLLHIVKTAPNEAYRLIAERVLRAIDKLAAAGMQFDFRIAHIGDTVPLSLVRARGVTRYEYGEKGKTPARATVWINGADVQGKVGMSYRTLLHEFVHAALMPSVRLFNLQAAAGKDHANDVAALYDVLGAMIKEFNRRAAEHKAGKRVLTDFESKVFNMKINALNDPDEVLAWGLTDRATQAWMESVSYQPQVSFWTKFVETIRSFLGLPARANTALAEVLRVADILLDAPLNSMADMEEIAGAVGTSMEAVQDTTGAQTATEGGVSKGELRAGPATLNARQRKAQQEVFGAADTRSAKDKAVGTLQGLGARFKANFVQQVLDQFAPIKKLSQKAYMMARMSTASDGALEALLLYGKVFVDENGSTDVRIGDGGFVKAMAKLQGEHQRFLQWVTALRAEKLAELGKENLFSRDSIAALKTLNEGSMPDGKPRHEVYTEALNTLNEYNDAVLKIAVKSGALSESLRQRLKDMPYVPFYRVMDDDTVLAPHNSSALTGQELWKKLSGGTSPLADDLLDNVLRNWSHVISASAKNRAAVQTLHDAVEKGYAKRVNERGDGAVRVKENGHDVYYKVTDAPLAEALSAMHYAIPEYLKPLNKFKRALTIGVTSLPGFKIKNLLRDSVQSVAVSNLDPNIFGNMAKGLEKTDAAGAVKNLVMTLAGKHPDTFAPQNQTYASMLAGGGLMRFGAMVDADRAKHSEALVRRARGSVTVDASTGRKLLDRIHDTLTAYHELGDASEQANRVALYDKLVAEGHSHAEAAFMARDLLDFSMQGKAPVIRFLVHSVPFLNARLQGLYKLASAATSGEKYDAIGLNKRFVDTAAAVATLSLALMLIGQDDKDWKDREDWDRDSYWWIKVGGVALRFPKPFEVGAIGTLAERTWEAMFDDEMTARRYGQRLGNMLLQTFAMNPVPQALNPLVDLYGNKDGFTGRAIESAAQEKMRREDRYTENTSMVARWLGQIGLPSPLDLARGRYEGMSPQQVDFLLQGYFGGLATMLTGAVDMLAKPGSRPSWTAKQMTSSFVDTLPADQSRYVQKLYDRATEVGEVYASYKDALARGDVPKAMDILASDGAAMAQHKTLEAAKERLAVVNRMIKRVDADQDLNAADKRERLSELYQTRNTIARTVASRVN